MIGKFKFYFDRLLGYYGRISQLLVVLLFLKTSHISYWYLIAFIVIAPIVIWIDAKFIIPQENAESLKRNPALRELFK